MATRLLGFAIKRADDAEQEECWLTGFKSFQETDPGMEPDAAVSTLKHPPYCRTAILTAGSGRSSRV